jgi:hypothetical protein
MKRRSSARPPQQHLTRPLEPAPTNKLGKSRYRGLRSPTRQPREAGEHGLCFLEPDVGHLAAVAAVPAERGPPEFAGLVDEEKNQLEGVRQATKSSSVAAASAIVGFPESRARRRRP